MASLCFRSLSTFVLEDNLSGLRNFLDGRNVQIDDRDENGATALMLAAGRPGSVGTALTSELIARGADVCAADLDGWSALLVAARAGHTDTCSLLLDHAADIEQRDMGGWTALMWAAYKGHTSTAQLLLSRNADTNAHGNYHISALVWASGRGHLQIVRALIAHGAKINVGDKYGTTALVWACRAGHVEIVRELLMQGANVDTTGMYSWTPLLVATQGNFLEVVNILLEYKPNVNALDKDGCTALTIACKEGFYEIATALLNAGAYINIQDRAGDTNLIHAVKGGHRGIVEALLKKYADVDVCGKDRKTALYTAVEKGNVGIVKLLLGANPDLEIATKDGDTPLLRAVRLRHTDIVQLLLERRARVSAADCRGDTALHVAMRARSRRLVEMLLRDPKHSQLLYRPNKHGETPYNIDLDHQKQILGQVFGARRLNTNEDNENMLGYDLYSSALADMLSEPSLSMPITVGLYARWGSGKSFLLSKLRDEMKNFARQWSEPRFNGSSLLFLALAHIALVLGVVVGVSTKSWLWGLIASVIFLGVVYVILGTLWYLSERYDWDWCDNLKIHINRKLNALRLILQVTFCHPPGPNAQPNIAQPIRFYFTDQTRVSGSAAGENSVVQMLGSLYDAIESSYGALPTRLYRAFRPKPMKSSTSWRLRRLCCVPYAAIFELCLIMLLVGTCALTVYLIRDSNRNLADTLTTSESIESVTINVILVTVALLLGVTCVANLYTWGRVLAALVFSQRRQLQRAIARLDTLKSEGFQQALTQEVNLMKDMVKCLDSLSCQQTRLVIIVDGLDSCEQDKVLLVLDAVHMLFSESNSPFIVILAIDPHVISKAVEVNSRRLFNESNIGGHDYLRSLVHLPFYLQNSGLRRVKMAQHAASQQQQMQQQQLQTHSRRQQQRIDDDMPGFVRSQSSRRLSTDSALMSSSEKLKPPTYISQSNINPASSALPRKSSRKLKASESIASSLGSNLNMVVGAHDLTKMLLTDDYFSDVNPRSMRRLMNVVYVTGRLLKAFQIEFNWYHLASWVNITEQWPYRTSWLVLYLEQQQQYDQQQDEQDGGFVIEDSTPLKALYDKIRPRIPNQKEVEPLLELDRDEKKFDIFLTFHRSSLQVLDLKIFLPFAINLDPYIKKVIKEEYQQPAPSIAPSANQGSYTPVSNPYYVGTPDWTQQQVTTPRNSFIPYSRPRSQVPITPIPGTVVRGIKVWKNGQMEDELIMDPMAAGMGLFYEGDRIPPTTSLPPLEPDLMSTDLASLSVSGVCQLIEGIKDLSPTAVNRYSATIKEHNINGPVLLRCNLNELKEIMNMSFGDWELFRMVIVSLRERQMSLGNEKSESRSETVRKKKGGSTRVNRSNERDSKNENNSMKQRQNNNHSIMEKQVTLEDQMICGALQTLNEEACEDVLEETVNIVDDDPNPQTKVVVSSSPSDQGFLSQQSNITGDRRRRPRSVSQHSIYIPTTSVDIPIKQNQQNNIHNSCDSIPEVYIDRT